MPSRRYKIENGVPVSINGQRSDPYELYLRKIKKYFLLILGLGIMILIISLFRLDSFGRGITSYFKFQASSLAYALEYSRYSKGDTYQDPKPADSVAVIVYHGLLDKYDGSEINTTIANFKDQMFALKREGYSTITTDQLYRFMRGEAELPKRSVMITFDDGRYESYINADPIFSALDFNAVMFIISSYSLSSKESTYYIGTEDLARMEKSGRWDIQAHTHESHNLIPTKETGEVGPFFGNFLWLSDIGRLENQDEFRQRISADMNLVKNNLSENLHKDIQSFAFPYGDFGQTAHNPEPKTEKDIVLEEARKRFSLLFYQDIPGQRFLSNYRIAPDADSFLIKRVDSKPEWVGEDLIKTLETSRAKELPFVEKFDGNSGWLKPWGILTINSLAERENTPNKKYFNEMILSSGGQGQSGAAIILDGSRMWKDYSLKTKIMLPNRNSAFAWIRFQDDDNNASCNLGEGFAHVEQTVNGVHRVIRGIRNPSLVLPQNEFDFEVKVKDRHVSCLINGKVVVDSQFLDPSLERGGIGFKTWDNVPGRGLMVMKSIEVTPL